MHSSSHFLHKIYKTFTLSENTRLIADQWTAP